MDCVCHLKKNNFCDVFRRILISQTVNKRLASQRKSQRKIDSDSTTVTVNVHDSN